MIDIEKLKKKAKVDEYIGTRIDENTKTSLESFCRDQKINISSLLTALVKDFLKSKGYLKD